MDKKEILKFQSHRPFAIPKGPWVMQQRWEDVLFLHYKIPYESLRIVVPERLILDTFNGECWISILPFKMRNVRFRMLPPIPTTHNFLELNLRTYVEYNGRKGIYFFSLDTSSTLAFLGGRTASIPYFRASMDINEAGGNCFFNSKRIGTKEPADFQVKYSPVSGVSMYEKESLEYWLTERYCLFQAGPMSKIIEIDIHHKPWPLQIAEAEIYKNTLTKPFGFDIPDQEPLIHYSSNQDVLVWPPNLH